MVATVLQPLVDVEEWTLEALHAIGLGWGLAIVALTVIVRLLTVPLTVRQFRAQQELAAHLPELRAIRDRHSGDPRRQQEETAEYHRRHGINPLAPLLPALVQIPVFLSLYALMQQDVRSGRFGHEGFLLVPDLTAQPHGVVLLGLITVYLATQVATSALATRTLGRGHRTAALALPVLFVGVASRFPAGLLVYWITSGFWSLGQQIALVRARTRAAPAVAAAVPRPAPVAASTGGGDAVRVHPRSKKRGRRRRR